MKLNIKTLSWAAEFAILVVVMMLFWKINIYLSVCIFVFHGLALIQVYKTQNLIGSKKEAITVRTKIRAGIIFLVFLFCIIINFIKNGLPKEERFLAITNNQLIDLSNGEMFPYLVLLSFMAALLMFGLTTERKKR